MTDETKTITEPQADANATGIKDTSGQKSQEKNSKPRGKQLTERVDHLDHDMDRVFDFLAIIQNERDQVLEAAGVNPEQVDADKEKAADAAEAVSAEDNPAKTEAVADRLISSISEKLLAQGLTPEQVETTIKTILDQVSTQAGQKAVKVAEALAGGDSEKFFNIIINVNTATNSGATTKEGVVPQAQAQVPIASAGIGYGVATYPQAPVAQYGYPQQQMYGYPATPVMPQFYPVMPTGLPQAVAEQAFRMPDGTVARGVPLSPDQRTSLQNGGLTIQELAEAVRAEFAKNATPTSNAEATGGQGGGTGGQGGNAEVTINTPAAQAAELALNAAQADGLKKLTEQFAKMFEQQKKNIEMLREEMRALNPAAQRELRTQIDNAAAKRAERELKDLTPEQAKTKVTELEAKKNEKGAKIEELNSKKAQLKAEKDTLGSTIAQNEQEIAQLNANIEGGQQVIDFKRANAQVLLEGKGPLFDALSSVSDKTENALPFTEQPIKPLLEKSISKEALIAALSVTRTFPISETANTNPLSIRSVLKNPDESPVTDEQLNTLSVDALITLLKTTKERISKDNPQNVNGGAYPNQESMIDDLLKSYESASQLLSEFDGTISQDITVSSFTQHLGNSAGILEIEVNTNKLELAQKEEAITRAKARQNEIDTEITQIDTQISGLMTEIASIDADLAFLSTTYGAELTNPIENPNSDLEAMTHEELIAEYKKLKDLLDRYEQLGDHKSILNGLDPEKIKALLVTAREAGSLTFTPWEGEGWPAEGVQVDTIAVYIDILLKAPDNGLNDAQRLQYQNLATYLLTVSNNNTVRFYGPNDTDPHNDSEGNPTNIIIIINNAQGTLADRSAQFIRLSALQNIAQQRGIDLRDGTPEVDPAAPTPEAAASAHEANLRALQNVNLLGLGLEKVEDKPKGWLQKAAEVAATIAGSIAAKKIVGAIFIGLTGAATGGILPVIGALAVSTLGGALAKSFTGSYLHYKVFNADKKHAMWSEHSAPPSKWKPFQNKIHNGLISQLGIAANLQGSSNAFTALSQLNLADPNAFVFNGTGPDSTLPGTNITRVQLLQSFGQLYELRATTNFSGLDNVEPKVTFKDAQGNVIATEQALAELGQRMGAIMAQNGMGPDTEMYKTVVGDLDKKIDAKLEKARREVVTRTKFQQGALIGGTVGVLAQAADYFLSGESINFGGWFDGGETSPSGFLSAEQFAQLGEKSQEIADKAAAIGTEIAEVDAANNDFIAFTNDLFANATTVDAQNQANLLRVLAEGVDLDVSDFESADAIIADLNTTSTNLVNLSDVKAGEFTQFFKGILEDMTDLDTEIAQETASLAQRGELIAQYGAQYGIPEAVEYGEFLQTNAAEISEHAKGILENGGLFSQDVDQAVATVQQAVAGVGGGDSATALETAGRVMSGAEDTADGGVTVAGVAVDSSADVATVAEMTPELAEAQEAAEELNAQIIEAAKEQNSIVEQINNLRESKVDLTFKLDDVAERVAQEQLEHIQTVDPGFSEVDFTAADLNGDGVIAGNAEYTVLQQTLGLPTGGVTTATTTVTSDGSSVVGQFLQIGSSADGNADRFIFPSEWSTAHGYMTGTALADTDTSGFLQGGPSGLGWGSIGEFFETNSLGMDQVNNPETARAAHNIVVQFQNGAKDLQEAISMANPNLIEGTVFDNFTSSAGVPGVTTGTTIFDFAPIDSSAEEFLNAQTSFTTQTEALDAQLANLQAQNSTALANLQALNAQATEADKLVETLSASSGNSGLAGFFASAPNGYWQATKEAAGRIWTELDNRDALFFTGVAGTMMGIAAYMYSPQSQAAATTTTTGTTTTGTTTTGGAQPTSRLQQAKNLARGLSPNALAPQTPATPAQPGGIAPVATGQQPPVDPNAPIAPVATPNPAGVGLIPRRNPDSNRFMAPDVNWREQDGTPPPAWAYKHPSIYGLGLRATNLGSRIGNTFKEAGSILGISGGNPFEKGLIDDINRQMSTNNKIYFLDPAGRVAEMDANLPAAQQRINKIEIVNQVNSLRNDVRGILAKEIPIALEDEFPQGINAAIGTGGLLGGVGEALKKQANILKIFSSPEGRISNAVNKEMADMYLQLLMIYNDPANFVTRTDGSVGLNEKGVGEANYILNVAASRDSAYRTDRVSSIAPNTPRYAGIPYVVTAAIHRIALKESGFTIPEQGNQGQNVDLFSNISQLTRTVAQVDEKGGLHATLQIISNQRARNNTRRGTGGGRGSRPQQRRPRTNTGNPGAAAAANVGAQAQPQTPPAGANAAANAGAQAQPQTPPNTGVPAQTSAPTQVDLAPNTSWGGQAEQNNPSA